MADFKFIRIPGPSSNSKIGNLEMWTISAPKRSHRPKQNKGKNKFCPFCPGTENLKEEVYRIEDPAFSYHKGSNSANGSDWLVRVINNKYPFAPIHEVVIHTPEHQNFSDLTLEEIRLVIEVYVNRYNTHASYGSVCIFCNSGNSSGESIGHTHSQIAVVPHDVQIIVPKPEKDTENNGERFKVKDFLLVCPSYSQWPDEVWVVPNERGRLFGEIRYEEIETLSYILKRLVKIFEIRHGNDFPFNFYIYPFHDWYIRIIPRSKIPGGFEIATGIFVNTQDSRETLKFIKEHFYEEEEEKIFKSKAEYRRGV